MPFHININTITASVRIWTVIISHNVCRIAWYEMSLAYLFIILKGFGMWSVRFKKKILRILYIKILRLSSKRELITHTNFFNNSFKYIYN